MRDTKRNTGRNTRKKPLAVQKAQTVGLIPLCGYSGGPGNLATGIYDQNNNRVGDQQTSGALLQGADKE